MTNLRDQVLSLFSASQHKTANHQKNSLELRKIYYDSNWEEFWQAFTPLLSYILKLEIKTKNPFVETIIQFIGVFCADLAKNQKNEDESLKDDPFITKIFDTLLLENDSYSDTTRFRACQLFNKIFDHFVEAEVDLTVEQYDLVKDSLSNRLMDTKGDIRIQGILALFRLQDPTDPEDPIISKFIGLMLDKLAKVRKVAVEKIAGRRDVVRLILKRTRDIDVNVRLAALKRISTFPKAIKIIDRQTVLIAAKSDYSDKIRNYVSTELLKSWWEIYNNNILLLMKSLRLDATEKDVKRTSDIFEYVLNEFYFKTKRVSEFFQVLQLNDEKLLPYDKLNWETVTYWKFLVMKFNSTTAFDDCLDKIVPEVVVFCRYVEEFSELVDSTETYLEKQYIIKQLFLMINAFDLSEAYTVRKLHALVDLVLKNVDLIDDVVETIIGILIKTLPDSENRSRFAMGIVSDILYPLDVDEQAAKESDFEFQLAKLTTKSIQLKHNQEEAIKAQDFLEAERLKDDIEDVSLQLKILRNTINKAPQSECKRVDDVHTICKCLDIVWAILRCARVSKLTPTLKSITKDFLPDLLATENVTVIQKALRCFAICCIYDRATAKHGIHMFAVAILNYEKGDVCDSQTLIYCISAISDLIRMHGTELVAQPNEDQISESVNEEHQEVFAGGTTLTSLIQGLVDLMEDEQFDVQIKACEGLCKLVLDEIIQSPSVIARLMLKWCYPADKDDWENQTMKIFIENFLVKLSTLSNCGKQLEGAILLTIDTLAKAPKTCPLANVDLDDIVMFMLTLCKLSQKGLTITCNITMALCTKINKNSVSKLNSFYSKVLLKVDLPKDQNFLEEIFILIEDAREYIDERVVQKNITKFLSKLSQSMNQSVRRTGLANMDIIEEGLEEEEEEEEME